VLRLREGDVTVEAEDVVWIVAVLEGDEAFEFFWHLGSFYPLGTRAFEPHEVDTGVAGLEGASCAGHTSEVSYDPFRHLRCEGRPHS